MTIEVHVGELIVGAPPREVAVYHKVGIVPEVTVNGLKNTSTWVSVIGVALVFWIANVIAAFPETPFPPVKFVPVSVVIVVWAIEEKESPERNRNNKSLLEIR